MPDAASQQPQTTPESTLSGWGRLAVPGVEVRSENLRQITRGAVLTRGLGRSYGDSSLPPPGQRTVAASPLADRVLAFDDSTGILRVEAGYSLQQLIRDFLPRGWFTPVTPGTQFVTLGGMVAADVHGKNHHCEGTIGRHVRSLRLRVASGDIVDCSREVERDLFLATVGGMGLTGHILEVEFTLARIPSPWIIQERKRVPNIDAYLVALKDGAEHWPMTMGWIDCLSKGEHLGRGVLLAGRWATKEEAPSHFPPAITRLPVPVVCPEFVMGTTVGKMFNASYYAVNWPKPPHIAHPEPFFYPLDVLLDWNKLYGRRGFTQHQCVLPAAAGPGAVRQLIELLASLGAASFLCVIKDCGEEGDGILSFPMPGTSVALDMPVRDNTQRVVDTLNEFVIQMKGRVYLAKDAFTRPEHFRAMEPRLERFHEIRRKWDPEGRLRSAQSVRLFGDHA